MSSFLVVFLNHSHGQLQQQERALQSNSAEEAVEQVRCANGSSWVKLLSVSVQEHSNRSAFFEAQGLRLV